MQAGGVQRSFRARVLEGVGAAAQLVNVAVSHVERALLPRQILSPAMPDGDLIVLQGADTRRGAALIDRLLKRPEFATADYDSLRPARPLLARTKVQVTGPNDVRRIDVQAVAPGADWARTTNRAGHVAIYVNGKYHSDLLVLAERRTGRYSVNLAGLGAGNHEIELRWAKDLDPTAVRPVVRSVATASVTGDDALVARFAPMIETRASRTVNGKVEQGPLSTDIPMVLAPTVERLADGGTRITYDLLLSNEDGGISVENAYRQLGRTIDQEMVYRVTLDRTGRRVRDMFQGPLHVPYSYRGARLGERPILTIATRNNLFTSREQATAPRWSEAPIAVATTRRTDRDLLVGNAWTTAVMGKELVREGRISAAGAVRPVHDARRYLFVGGEDAVRQALRGTGTLHLRLTDGTIRKFEAKALNRSLPFPFSPPMGTAIALPDDLTSDAIAGIVELKDHTTRATFVLDENYQARVLGA